MRAGDQWRRMAEDVPIGSDTHFLFIGSGTSLYIAQSAAQSLQEITGHARTNIRRSVLRGTPVRYHTDGPVERALITASDRVKEVSEQFGVKVEETMSSGLRRFGVPTREEVRRLQAEVYRIAARHGGIKGGSENGRRGYQLTFAIAYIRLLGVTSDE